MSSVVGKSQPLGCPAAAWKPKHAALTLLPVRYRGRFRKPQHRHRRCEESGCRCGTSSAPPFQLSAFQGRKEEKLREKKRKEKENKKKKRLLLETRETDLIPSSSRSPTRFLTGPPRKSRISAVSLLPAPVPNMMQVPCRVRSQEPLPGRGRKDPGDLEPQEHGRLPKAPRRPVVQGPRCPDRAGLHLGAPHRDRWPGRRRGHLSRQEGAVHCYPADGHVFQQDQADHCQRD